MRWFSAALITLSILCTPLPGLCQARAEGPDPLLCAIPPQAVFAGLVDLRSDTESMKALATGHTPEQLAMIRAAALLGLQQLLVTMGTDLDIEKDVLPWVTRRLAVCFFPIPGKKDPGVALLLETQGGTPAAACIERLLQGGAKSGQLVASAAVEGVPVWKAPKLGPSTYVTYVEPILVLSLADACLPHIVKQMKSINAGAAISPTAQAILGAPAGMARFAVAPAVFARPQNPGAKAMGVSGITGAMRYNAEGSLAEVALAVNPQAGPWAALASVKPTFSESVAGIPDTAIGVVAVARPAMLLHGMGVPLTDAIAAGMVGPPPLKAIGKSLAPVLSDVLGQEVALALMPGEDDKPTWLAVFTSARPTAFTGMMDALVQAAQGAQGISVAPAPLGGAPGWAAKVSVAANRPPVDVHLAVVDARLLAAGTRKALEAGAAALTRRAPSVAAAEWYTKGGEVLGPRPLAKCAAKAQSIGPALAAMLGSRVPLPTKYVARLMDAMNVGVRQMGAGIRMDGNTIRAIGYSTIDYPKMASLGGAVVPSLVSLGMMAISDQLSKAKAGGKAGAPAAIKGDAQAEACASNLRQLAMAAQQYNQDWGKLPRAEGWVEALEPYVKNKALFRCPADGDQRATCYAFNRALAEIPPEQIENPAKTILFYECASADASPSGRGEGLPNPGRHQGKHLFAFADGHVELAAAADPAWWGKK